MLNRSSTGVSIAKWKDDGKLKVDTSLLFEVLQRLDPYVLTDGTFIDKETNKIIHRNHIKCMMRLEYIAAGGELRGKPLQFVIERFLIAMAGIAKRLHEQSDNGELERHKGFIKAPTGFLK